MVHRPVVVIGLLGPTLDTGRGAKRWNRWRPTVGLHMQDDLAVDRCEILHQQKFDDLATTVVKDIEQVSPDTAVRQHHVEFRDPWDMGEVYAALWSWARSYPWKPDEEDYLVHITTGTHIAQISLFLLAESRHLPARLIQTQPSKASKGQAPNGPRTPAKASKGQAPNGPRTPASLQGSVSGTFNIIDLDLSKYDKLAGRFAEERAEGVALLAAGVPSRNSAMAALQQRVEQVAAASTAPILLGGPTGAGKTVLARRIYELKKNRNLVDGPFVELNCATVRGDAAGSALFGHKAGAFTGAIADRDGLLKRADDGVLFLDEIGELGADEQAMLLRAIEDKVFLPMGADQPVLSDFQLIAGSNRDLREEVHTGRFRADLLARIDLWTFDLPGLAQRQEDIEPNLDVELDRFAEEMGRRVRFNREARQKFLAFATSAAATWDGNFRDLGAAATRLATLAPAGRIDVPLVDEEIGRLRRQWRPADACVADDAIVDLLGEDGAANLDRFDRVQLADVIAVCRRAKSLSAAGRELFAASRQRRKSTNDADRLKKYLARFDLDWQAIQG